MREEIPFTEGKIIMTRKENFWIDILEKCKGETKQIDIATYNFNFKHKGQHAFYTKLSELADLGINIRLLYSITNNSHTDNVELEKFFKDYILCVRLIENHSKMFITDTFAYIGSANFSLYSDENYECGVLFTEKNIVSKLRKIYAKILISNGNFENTPSNYFAPFYNLEDILQFVTELKNVEYKEDLYLKNILETIPLLRGLDDMRENLIKIEYPIDSSFDWLSIYFKIHDDGFITKQEFEFFKEHINILFKNLMSAQKHIQHKYNTVGKTKFLEELTSIN